MFMGDYSMKLTLGKLRNLVKQVVKENRMTLVEEVMYLDEDQVIRILRGEQKKLGKEEIITVGIMSAQNPDAQSLPPSMNKELSDKLEADINADGLTAIRMGGFFGQNDEDSLLILNPHKGFKGDTGGRKERRFAHLHGDAKEDAIAYLDKLNNRYSQWGYVLGTKEPADDVNKMRFEMKRMEKYPPAFSDEGLDLPGEDEYEDIHHGESYMQEPGPSPDASVYSAQAPYSKIARTVDINPAAKDYSYVTDPEEEFKGREKGKRINIPLYEVKVGRKIFRIKRRR
jgi:hypothetical protein